MFQKLACKIAPEFGPLIDRYTSGACDHDSEPARPIGEHRVLGTCRLSQLSPWALFDSTERCGCVTPALRWVNKILLCQGPLTYEFPKPSGPTNVPLKRLTLKPDLYSPNTPPNVGFNPAPRPAPLRKPTRGPTVRVAGTTFVLLDPRAFG